MTRFIPGLLLLLPACGAPVPDGTGDTGPVDTEMVADTEAGSTDTDPPTTDTETAPDTDDTDAAACRYPAGAVEPMAVGEVLYPYSWPRALRSNGADLPLDLAKVPCATDPDIDWSPFDVLLFVSIPAW